MRSLLIGVIVLVAAACGAGRALAADASAGPAPGLKLTLESNGVTDTRAARLVAFRSALDSPPSPFLARGEFKATWEGVITQRIKGEYSFMALGRGALKVTINDAVALDVSGDDLSGKPGPTVPLKKGKNTFRAEYTSRNSG